MNSKKKNYKISRRKFIPVAAGGVMLPFLGFSNSTKSSSPREDMEYATMLTANGNVVKVKRSALKKARIVKKNLSNTSLLQWLNKKKGNKL